MKFTNLFASLLFIPAFVFAQSFNVQTEVEDYLQKNSTQLQLSQYDYTDYSIYREYESKQTQLRHVFLQQNFSGTPIHKAEIRLHYRADKGWMQTQNTFVSDLENQQVFSQTSLNQLQAIESACRILEINYSKPSRISKKNEATTLYKADFSIDAIPVKEAYFQFNNTLRKVWDLTIYEKDATDCWNVLVDANTGEILRKYNWVQHCSFNAETACSHSNHDELEVIEEFIATPVDGPTYNVFAIPLESPSHGERTMEVSPNNSVASPYGWHDTDGIEGAEYTITRGNNVHAYADLTDSNTPQDDEPNGGTSLVFDFPFDNMTEPDQNLDAATVNLFYMSNMMHDVWYH